MIATAAAPTTMDELLESLGGISPKRVLLSPAPGTATVKDVIRYLDGDDKRLVELIDGTLVEKTLGFEESLVAGKLNRLVGNFAEDIHRLGLVTIADGAVRLLPQQVRIPDVAFFSWDRLPDRTLPFPKVPKIAPNLAIEVLSESNTVREMERKLDDYFSAGVELVWYVDPVLRTVEVYTSLTDCEELKGNDTLTGGTVLPGFSVTLDQIFASLSTIPAAHKKKKK